MDPIGDDMYEITVGPFAATGPLYYSVHARDGGGTQADTEQQSIPIQACPRPSIGAIDQDVDEIFVPPCHPDHATLFATAAITDASIVSAEAWLRPLGEAAWSTTIPMQQRPDSNRWETTIGPLPEPDTWEWKVVARNTLGGQTESEATRLEVLACEGDPPRFQGIRTDDQGLFLEPCTPSTTRIWTSVEADFPLDRVDLLYGWESTGWLSYQAPMQYYGPTDEYGVVIGPFEGRGTIAYQILATDLAGLETVSDVRYIDVRDCQPGGPDISSIQMDEERIYPAPCTPDAARVQAIVTEEPGRSVTQVKLHYAQGNSTDFQDVPMILVTQDTYEATISGLTEPDIYRFYIEAQNDLGGISESYTESFVVAPCIVPGPIIEDVDVLETALFAPPCEPDRTERSAFHPVARVAH